MNFKRFCIIVCLSYANFVQAQAQVPLTFNDVVNSALEAFPTLLASQQRIISAQGEYQTAQGAFDTSMKSKNQFSLIGLYENENNDLMFEQPIELGGATFFGGWRRGLGDYPVYDGKKLTTESGEVQLGVNLPLWRNSETDRRRTSLKQASLGQLIASHEYDQTFLDIQRQAAHRYWDWVLAGQRLKIAEKLLDIAQKRNDAIKQRVAAGDIPEFEALDNQRAIIERQERQVSAQRLLEQTAIQLSLYWRDLNGEPILPHKEQLPMDFPEKELDLHVIYENALEIAKNQRPELRRLEIEIQQVQAEIAFQENQQNPVVDLSVMGAKDIGNDSNSKNKPNRDELYVGLNMEIPLQRNAALGRTQVASSRLQRLKHEQVLIENRITNEVKDVLSALSAFKKRLILSKEQCLAAEKLEEGERTRFELGESTLLFVNLREIAHGDAALQVAEATGALLKTTADYQAILAVRSFKNG